MRMLVTGSSGLIGSEAVAYFDALGHEVHGVDNNMRRAFFGEHGDTAWNLRRLQVGTRQFVHHEIDIQDRDAVFSLFMDYPIDAVIHCAAQPSHDWARKAPLVDFGVNATGTLHLLEATRLHAPQASFVFMSTNKVYGDAPNDMILTELPTRWEYALPDDFEGVDESCRLDQSMHSLFGVSKLAADVLVQEYGRYFGLNTVCFRGGCVTGPAHSGVELHGFLSYLVRTALMGQEYSIYGYKGKQVRDQIHCHDVVTAMACYLQDPRPAAVYNLGGGRGNSASVLEAIGLVQDVCGSKLSWQYEDQHRAGDHICYISDTGRFRRDYPQWSVSRGLPEIVEEMVRLQATRE